MFNKIRTIGKIAKTVASPITHARNVISSALKKKPNEQVTKYKKKALKMIKDATSKAGKSAKQAESKIGKDEAQKIGRETKSKMIKDYLKYNRDLKAKGGRIGLKKGGKVLKPVDKQKNPGLAKLPTQVRNKTGSMKKGGSVKQMVKTVTSPITHLRNKLKNRKFGRGKK